MLTALLWVTGACVAQSPTPPLSSAGSFRIAGRVVDGSNGRPLRRASVTIFPNGSGGGAARQDVETADNGVFAFSGLPAGKYRLQGAARGYITAAYDEHEQYSSAIVTGAGIPTEALLLQLQSAAMLSGRVTDEAGDPVRNASVSVFRENTEQGSRRITRFRDVQTDDLGAYEATRLPPGTYYACVRATPWYATYAPLEQPGANFGVAANVDPALSVVYPLTYYPAATDSEGASAMTLHAGDRYHADFHLTPQPALHLTVQMPPDTDGRAGRNFPQLQQKVFDALEPVQMQRIQTAGTTLEIQGLSAGNYVLRQLRQGGPAGAARPVNLAGGSLTVDATQPVSFGPVTLLLDTSEKENKLPATLRLALRQGERGEPAPSSAVKDGQVEFTDVAPGDYRIEPLNNRWHVDAVTIDGKTRPGAMLHVSGEGQTATITLGAGTVSLAGYVRREGKGVSGAMVVLVPAGGDHSVDLYRRDQSDLDGSFVFNTVVPGNYLLVAISDGWPLEWGKPEALAPYLAKAVPVTVPANSRGPMKIEEAVPVQPR